MKSYDLLLEHLKKIQALGQVSGLLSWDQEVMMPPNGASARAEQSGALAAVLHEMSTDDRLGEWLADIDVQSLDEAGRANVRLAKRSHERAIKLPTQLSEELARTTALAQGIWAKARLAASFSDFAPVLENIVELKRTEADCLADGGSRYDALLQDFEPGMTCAVLQPLLENMRPRLSTLRQKIVESGVTQPVLSGPFNTDVQLNLARKLADVVGFDWQSGRLDLSVHPFSSGTGGDARITTRVDADEPLGCLYSTVHELGHALYEQGVPSDHALTPAGTSVSMGVHESQSRLWENQIGRSRSFCSWLYPHFIEAFPDCGVANEEALYRVINRVETGFIRTEADEVHYNLHVLLRFELERDLISGELSVKDLEAEWDRRFKRDFGVAVPDASLGVLQDVHWSVGLFGYFPTYSLGNIYAGQLNVKMHQSIADLSDQLALGKTASVLGWLRQNIHQHGSIHEPDHLIESVVGEKVSSDPLLDYLEQKYSDLFDLT